MWRSLVARSARVGEATRFATSGHPDLADTGVSGLSRTPGVPSRERARVDSSRGRQGRDRGVRERAARDRALARVRAARGCRCVGAEEVSLLLCGVSSSKELFEHAEEIGAQMVLVHHGLFWRNEPLVVDRRLRGRLEALFRADASLLAYHLALDAHAELGNAAQLAVGSARAPTGRSAASASRARSTASRSRS